MKWNKLGHIFAPSGDLHWAKSYAHLPTVDVIDDEIIRVYFAALDVHKYGRIGYVDLDINNPKKILHVTNEPILDIGELGCFDDCGVNPSCILNIEGKKHLYYIGWQKSSRVPYMLFAGLALSTGQEKFEKYGKTPILERIPQDSLMRSAISVIQDGDTYKAWYVSGLEWITVDSMQYPSYIIRYAESLDGIQWNPHDKICINFKDEHEFGFGRPWVIKDNNVYKMWYSIRSRTAPYKIGYAESKDGLDWIRKDEEVGIEKSAEGWDSEMICYPCVTDIKGKRYMFYNGNQHGSTGFGVAVLEQA